MAIQYNKSETPIFDVFTAFQIERIKNSNGKTLVLFFKGSIYATPSKNDLMLLKEYLNNTIDSYEEVDDYLAKENTRLLQDLHNDSFESVSIEKPIVKSGFVYVVKCTTTNFYKIGMTAKNVDARIKQLRTSNPTIELIKFFKVNDVVIEKKLHEMFADKNVNREWFSLSKLDLKIIEKFISEKQ